ncbi:MAG: hypothetical protein IJ572_00855 [Bacilli bacterium]|nr:hypothetical protein [Bacilli bacterium]
MKKLIISRIFYFIIGALIFGGISTVLAYSFLTTDVSFTPTDSNWNVDNANLALDELRAMLTKSGEVVARAYYHDKNKATVSYTATKNCKLIAAGGGTSIHYGDGTTYSSITTTGTYIPLVENKKESSASTSYSRIYAYAVSLKPGDTVEFSIWSNQGNTSNIAILIKV